MEDRFLLLSSLWPLTHKELLLFFESNPNLTDERFFSLVSVLRCGQKTMQQVRDLFGIPFEAPAQ